MAAVPGAEAMLPARYSHSQEALDRLPRPYALDDGVSVILQDVETLPYSRPQGYR